MKEINTQDPRKMSAKALLKEFEEIGGDILDTMVRGTAYYVDEKGAEEKMICTL